MTLRKLGHASLAGGPIMLRRGWPHDPAKLPARWPHDPANRHFRAFVKLACIAIYLRQPTFRGFKRYGDSHPEDRLSDAF